MGAHLVQFYENENFLIKGLSEYIGSALATGNKGIVIATRHHLDQLEEVLDQRGLLQAAGAHYIPLEVDHLLPLFMSDGLPDKLRFHQAIGNVIACAAAQNNGYIYIYGEMVAILCGARWSPHSLLGRHDAAIQVERYFNELLRQYTFSLLCGYPMSAFPGREDSGMFNEVCKLHSHVVPAESFNPAADIDTLQRTIASLQQQAFSLAAEVHEREQIEQALREVNFDRLTGLPNRSVFQDRLDMDVRKSQRSSLPLAVMFIDLDHFKEINDTLGHEMGDQLLCQVGQRLATYVRQSDTVARLGGDEFTIILNELHDLDTVTDIAQKILDDLARPFELDGELAYISSSIGITLYPQDALSVGDLLRNADQAMYQSKDGGRNRFAFFTRSMQEAAQARMRLSNDLRRAVADEQLQVFYQPIVSMESREIVKAEALLRWEHPSLGRVSPTEFIPIAEHTGMIVPIGDRVFREALAQAHRWRVRHPGFCVSVNVSPAQFYRNNGEHLQAWLSQPDMDGGCAGRGGQAIGIEITEGLLLAANSSVMQRLLAFQEAGISLTLDDFGTGYSSLSYLRKFRLDFLKIDQSFIFNLETDSSSVALCEAIIVMAHKLGLKVVAEGVETERQADMLRLAGCDFGQGFLFGHAVTAHQFEAYW